MDFTYQFCSPHNQSCKYKCPCDCLPHSERELYSLDRVELHKSHLLHMQDGQGNLSQLCMAMSLSGLEVRQIVNIEFVQD